MGNALRLAIPLLALILALLCTCPLAAAEHDEIAPLALQIESSRRLCTIGTSTEISWTISGGVPPYTLTVDGQAVDPSASSTLVPCGAAANDLFEELFGLGTERWVSATVADRDGRSSSTYRRVALVHPLPPPRKFSVSGTHSTHPHQLRIVAEWEPVGPLAARGFNDGYFVVRWREPGQPDWCYENGEIERWGSVFRREWRFSRARSGHTLEIQVAAIRTALEASSPASLKWSASRVSAVASQPTGLTARVTHDTISLSWSPGSSAERYLPLIGRDFVSTASAEVYEALKQIPLATPNAHTAQLTGLLPASTYRVVVVGADSGLETSFEVRTEVAPAGWSRDQRAPQNPRVIQTGDHVELRWDPPADGPEHAYVVETYQYGEHSERPRNPRQQVPLGERAVRLATLKAGRTYGLVVSHSTSPGIEGSFGGWSHPESAQLIYRVPFPGMDESTTGAAPPPPVVDLNSMDQVWDWNTRYAGREHPSQTVVGVVAVRWAPPDDVRRTQVRWTEDGQTVSLVTESPGLTLALALDYSESLQIRHLGVGGWTPWSAALPFERPPIYSPRPRVVELDGRVIVSWWRESEVRPALSYRVHLSRPDGAERVIDVGSVDEYAFVPDDNTPELRVSMGAYNAAGAAPPSDYETLRRRSKGLTLSLGGGEFPCVPRLGFPAEVTWWINGGVEPFVLRIGGNPPLQTSARTGRVEVYCNALADSDFGGEYRVHAHVSDQRGARTSDETSVWLSNIEKAEMALAAGPVRMRERSVHRTDVKLNWDCRSWNGRYPVFRGSPFALRWRTSEAETWTYETWGYPVGPRSTGAGSNSGCPHVVRWTHLEPATRYLFQVTPFAHPTQFEAPEQLPWTPTQTVTTLGDATNVRLEQGGDAVTVSWDRQPDAWAYQVILRTEGMSWWRLHYPNGAGVEQLSFNGVPDDQTYSVEIITPPQRDGYDLDAPGYTPVWRAGA